MKRKLTITVTEDVYAGLHAVVGPGNISQFLEDLARPHVVRQSSRRIPGGCRGRSSRARSPGMVECFDRRC
jgi:hypothetical protein